MTLSHLKSEARAEFYAICGRYRIGENGSNAVENLQSGIETLIDRVAVQVKEEIKDMPAFKNLKEEQGRLDEEGIMVVVSRQALDELLAAISSL